MNLKKLLQEQGKYYKDLPINKTIETCNEKVESRVQYRSHWISRKEYNAIKELEKRFNKEPGIASMGLCGPFEISIKNNKITYLKIGGEGLKQIPKQINNLQNLEYLCLIYNGVQKIENLDNLTNLEILYLNNNQISKIEGLDNLTNLQVLILNRNQITEIEGLDNLTSLDKLFIRSNPIINKGEVKELRKKGIKVWI